MPLPLMKSAKESVDKEIPKPRLRYATFIHGAMG